MAKILVTGAAGFIGFHICKRLINSGQSVIGLDNLNSYYDVNLKNSRVAELRRFAIINENNFDFYKCDLCDSEKLNKIFNENNFSVVINLAAQAGVRFSIKNPDSYIKSNICGFLNILENCRNKKIKNLIYASSSSVYGGNLKIPFCESDSVDHPVSLYAATKKSNELMAHAYSNLFNIPSTGLRFFTVYGPWGRPDMAPMIFTKSILNKTPITIFNKGNMFRDFTYIDDIVESIMRLINKPAEKDNSFDRNNPNPSTSWVPHRIYNIGNSESINLMEFINNIEEELGIKAIKIFKEMQPGDVIATEANTKAIEEFTGYRPNTPLKIGIKKFVIWFRNYYKL